MQQTMHCLQSIFLGSCNEVDPDWRNVRKSTVPPLPVQHDTAVEILCKPNYINVRTSIADCKDGSLMMQGGQTPQCNNIGALYCNASTTILFTDSTVDATQRGTFKIVQI